MKTAVKRYGFINAKLRARLSEILPPEFRKTLLQAGSLEETLQILKDTEFAPLSEIYDKTGDLQYVELELFKMQIAQYRSLHKYADETIRNFVEAMSLKLEVENLKNVFRLWYGSKIKNRPIGYRGGYIYRETIFHKLNWDKILNASTFDEIADIITPEIYQHVLAPFRKVPLEDTGIFRLEVNLDRMYYMYLWEKSRELPRKDRKTVERILSAEAELQNLNWIIRYSHYYQMEAPDLVEILIPLGKKIAQKDIQAYLSQDPRQRDLSILTGSRFPELSLVSLSGRREGEHERGTSQTAQALLFEQLLDETQKGEFMKLINGYPFTIGIVLVYFFMKSREGRFVMAVLNGKYYGWKADKIREVAG